MHFCSCGEPAAGQCVMGGEYVCQAERTAYSPTVADLLRAAGKEPPSDALRGVLCPTCFTRSVQEALPVVLPYLRENIGGPEHVAAWMGGRLGSWRGSLNHRDCVAVQIITAAAGVRPPWLFSDGPKSLAALFATRARTRGMTPPRITVIVKENRSTPTLFNKHKRTEVLTKAGEFRAWHFTCRDLDGGGPRLFLVGLEGAAFMPSQTWSVNANREIMVGGSVAIARNDVADTVGRLTGPPENGYLPSEVAPPLAHAVQRLL